MALKSTIFKAELQVSDLDNHYYGDHLLTIARHPSETDGRMMVRVLAFALNADEALLFTRGVSSDDEPDLWKKDLSGNIRTWIELGQPNEKRIRKSCGRAKEVIVYCYNDRSAADWWGKIKSRLERFGNLSVICVPSKAVQSLAGMVRRTMQLQCTIQDGQVWLAQESETVQVDLMVWKQPR